MVDLNNVVQGLSKSGAVSGFAGGLAGTALAGALSGKKGKKMAKSAVKVGALAAVGGLAYTAWQRYRQQPHTAGAVSPRYSSGLGQPPADRHSIEGSSQPTIASGGPVSRHLGRWDRLERSRFEAGVDERPGRGGGLLMVRAMIAAAAADGHLSRGEQSRIFVEASRQELTPEEKATLFDELSHPMMIHELANQVPDEETALEIYAASLVAVDETRPEAHAYLRQLAQTLELPASLIVSLHAQADAARRAEAA
jgi:uncharacterized membrane protein YebE (DUF533 family)